MKQYALGVDIGGTNIKYIILDNSGKEIDHFTNSTEANKGRTKILKNIISGIQTLLKNNPKLKLAGIGVGSPGFIQNGKVISGAWNFKNWNGTNIKQYLEKNLNLPVFVDNDVTCVALGEAYFGAGKNKDRVLCAALGTGLGGGIVINKKVYRGKHGYAAEFGHMILNPSGPKCSCGKKGCLETYASATGLKQLAKIYLKNNKNSKIFKYAKNINDITPIDIFKAFYEKDKIATKIINDMGYYLGQGLGILINIFDPDIIIIAGGISKEGKPLLDLIYQYVYKFTLPFYNNKVKIALSKFKQKSGVIGTASLVFEQLNIPVIKK